MTTDIARRNRANATKSTGPRTQAGKAAVSGNARRHGATARPDPARVGLWLRIILAQPDLTLTDFIPCDERRFRALALAEAGRIGVDTDAELQNLIEIEHAFSANLQVIQTASRMLQEVTEIF